NHASSQLNSDIIDQYIISEQNAGCYSCAYSILELESLISPFCTSPLGLVPKPHSMKFRLVQD
ncbi:uncharacterized protein EDB91DRAFT_1026978, partial [Suillus paluster]|uniref:uncharacterized protein n=1 Tax=Suillus paluster TaxID=48578 RepID=UPI001B873DBF